VFSAAGGANPVDDDHHDRLASRHHLGKIRELDPDQGCGEGQWASFGLT
jgi:hypothetical protein